MPNLGITELLVILMILLLVFGGSRLPQIGESLGRTARSFKRGFASNDNIKVEAARQSQGDPADPQLPPSPSSSGRSRPADEIADAEWTEKKG